jgi:hypothetical protein
MWLIRQSSGGRPCTNKAEPGLNKSMDLVYLTGQCPTHVSLMRSDDREGEGDYFVVIQGKTKQKLTIMLKTERREQLGKLIRKITERNAHQPPSTC